MPLLKEHSCAKVASRNCLYQRHETEVEAYLELLTPLVLLTLAVLQMKEWTAVFTVEEHH